MFVFLEPLLVLIEYVPFGDLLGYLRKSRGLNDTYYKDPDIKPQTNLTSQQLMKFAWQIADGMSYLSSIPVSDVTILLVISLENKAHTHYTSLIIDSWTPPPSQLIKCRTTTNTNLVSRVFPRLKQVAWFYSEFSFVNDDVKLRSIGGCDYSRALSRVNRFKKLRHHLKLNKV